MLDIEQVPSWCVLCKLYFCSRRSWISHQTSLGICELYVLAYQQLKSETRFEILSCSLLDPLYWVAMRPNSRKCQWEKFVSCCLPSACKHQISLELSGLVVVVQDRFWRWERDNQSIICQVVCAIHGLCHSGILSVFPSHYDIVNEMSMFGTWTHLWCLCEEDYIGDLHIMHSSFSLEQNNITVAFAYANWFVHSTLCLVVWANSGI